MITQSSVNVDFVKLYAIFILLFATEKGANAQNNTSYNANTNPIGGIYSTAFGANALYFNTGTRNTATGNASLLHNIGGNYNMLNKGISINGVMESEWKFWRKTGAVLEVEILAADKTGPLDSL